MTFFVTAESSLPYMDFHYTAKGFWEIRLTVRYLHYIPVIPRAAFYVPGGDASKVSMRTSGRRILQFGSIFAVRGTRLPVPFFYIFCIAV